VQIKTPQNNSGKSMQIIIADILAVIMCSKLPEKILYRLNPKVYLAHPTQLN
jgi:hypothetical protein